MPSEPYIIVNPNANTGKLGKKIDSALALTKEYIGDFEYVVTERPQHEKELAAEAIKKGYKTLVALGGDGTATNMGDTIIDHPDVTLGLLSAGSMCDWHKTHSIPYDLEKSLQILAEGHSEKFPAIKCSGDRKCYAFDMTDGGFTAKAAAAAHYEMKWMKIGLIKYNYLALKYVLKTKNTPAKITLDDRDPIEIPDLTNAFAALGDDISGFHVLPSNAEFSQKNKDLGIAIAHGMKGLNRVRMLIKAIPGNHVGMKGIHLDRCRKMIVETAEPLCWENEGEIYSENSTRIEIERIDDAINLIVPKVRSYKVDYDEEIYHQKFEESYANRKFEKINK
ncbi:MAG: diacylglycerol/lipid kinase family protein [Candidatus Heimdallarchaeaceae archaeon]